MHLRFFLFAFFFVSTINAQDSAEASSSVTNFITEKSFNQGNYTPADTSLDYYHYYYPGFFRNFKNLGFIGSPVQSMFYSNPEIIGFYSGINFLDPYISKKENVRYFNTRRPYSKVFFLMGTKEEQTLNFKHSQNIGKPFNFGIDFTNITNTGFYIKQKTRLNDFHVHASYETKNRLYGNFSNFIYDRISFEENGGLLYDFYFEEFLLERKDAIPVSFQNATNLFRKKSWFFKNYFNLGRKEDFFDTKDSVNRKMVVPYFRLSHTFSFEKQISSFRDASPDSILYLPLFNYNNQVDPIDTIKDSLNIKVYENSFSLSTVDFTDISGKHQGFKNFFSSVSVKHQNIERLTHNDNFDTSFQNLLANAEMNFRFLRNFIAGGSASQVLSGYNKDEHYYKGFLEFRPSYKSNDSSNTANRKKHFIRIESFHQVKKPDWIYERYYSDQFSWINNFQNISYSGQSLSYENEKWRIKAGVSQNFVKNPVYLTYEDIFTEDTVFSGTRIHPRQRLGRFTINQAYLVKHFKLWKFNFIPRFYYQQTSNSIVFAYPDIISYNTFSFESLMLRKAVYGQIGVDFYFHSGYYANAYSPLLKQFYVQAEKSIGDYPFLDFFINIKIKSVRAFFKITHVNSGFFGNTYYLIPHYPQADRAFKLGIDWRFLD